jgi:hypothetical protein
VMLLWKELDSHQKSNMRGLMVLEQEWPLKAEEE